MADGIGVATAVSGVIRFVVVVIVGTRRDGLGSVCRRRRGNDGRHSIERRVDTCRGELLLQFDRQIKFFRRFALEQQALSQEQRHEQKKCNADRRQYQGARLTQHRQILLHRRPGFPDQRLLGAAGGMRSTNSEAIAPAIANANSTAPMIHSLPGCKTLVVPEVSIHDLTPGYSKPPNTVPRMLAMKLLPSSSPLPRDRIEVSRISGNMPYLAGTKNALWVPIKNTTDTNSTELATASVCGETQPKPARSRQQKTDHRQRHDSHFGHLPRHDDRPLAVFVGHHPGQRREQKERNDVAGRHDHHNQLRVDVRHADEPHQHVGGVEKRHDVAGLIVERRQKLRQHQRRCNCAISASAKAENRWPHGPSESCRRRSEEPPSPSCHWHAARWNAMTKPRCDCERRGTACRVSTGGLKAPMTTAVRVMRRRLGVCGAAAGRASDSLSSRNDRIYPWPAQVQAAGSVLIMCWRLASNSKSEARNPKQARSSKFETHDGTRFRIITSVLRFVLRICFEIRISTFGFFPYPDNAHTVIGHYQAATTRPPNADIARCARQIRRRMVAGKCTSAGVSCY